MALVVALAEATASSSGRVRHPVGLVGQRVRHPVGLVGDGALGVGWKRVELRVV